MQRKGSLATTAVPLHTRTIGLLACFSGVLAVVPLIVFYPGVWTADTYARWQTALWVYDAAGFWQISMWDWYPPLMALTMALTYTFTKSVVLFTYLQYYFVLFAAMMGGYALSRSIKLSILIGIITFCLPGSVDSIPMVMPDYWTGAALLFTTSAVFFQPQGRLLKRLPFYVLLFFFDSVLFGFRYNTLLLFPLYFVAALALMETRREKIWYSGVLIASAGATFAIKNLPIIVHVDVASTVFLWEIVSTLKVLNDQTLNIAYNVDGVGDMEKAISLNNFWNQDGLYFGNDAPLQSHAVLKHASEIHAKWLDLVTSHPAAYLQAKLEIWKSVLGMNWIGRPLDLMTGKVTNITPELDHLMTVDQKFGLGWIRDWLSNESRRWPDVFYTPYQFILISFGFLLIHCVLRARMIVPLTVSFFGVCYYASFFLLTPGFVMRYYFPTYYALSAVTIFILLQAFSQSFEVSVCALRGFLKKG